MEDGGKKKGEESESEESYKSEEISSEDACSHCGLPNHPELVSASVGNCAGRPSNLRSLKCLIWFRGIVFSNYDVSYSD